MDSERLIREMSDRDFGRLSLWENRSEGGPIGGPVREIILLNWRGEVGGVDLEIAVGTDSQDAVRSLDDALRAAVRALSSRAAELATQAAGHVIDVARDWSEDAELASLASALRLDLIDVDAVADAPSIAVWFEITTGALSGHAVRAEVDDNNNVSDASLLE